MALGMPSYVQDKLQDSTKEAQEALERARVARDNCKDDSQRQELNDAVTQARANLKTVMSVAKEAKANSNNGTPFNDHKLPKNQNELITNNKVSQIQNKLKGSPVKDISDPNYDPNEQENKPVKNSMLSASFYRDLSASLRGKPTGNKLDAQAAGHREQVQNLKNDAANRQMEAQSSQQIANRSEFAEAGKIASMQNDAENRQNINNLSASVGNAAALQRKTNAPDVQSQQARQDQQRNVANQRREMADTAQEAVSESNALANQADIDSRDFNDRLDKSNSLSMGETVSEEDTEQGEDETTNESQGDQEEQDTQNVVPDETPSGTQQPQPQPPVKPQAKPPVKAKPAAKPQSQPATDPAAAAQEAARKANAERIKNSKPEKGGNYPAFQTPENWNLMTPEERVKAYRDQGLDITDDSATPNFRIPTGWSLYTPKDRRAEYERQGVKFKSEGFVPGTSGVLSDMRMKWIKEDMDRDGRPSEEDFMWLLHKAGKLKHNDREYDAFNEDDFTDSDDSVLGAYADHIRNYVYNYKPGAEQIDPRNDPNVEHIGPMAQDIEQVNPACVNENEQGIKSVDTGRLAMMNAGAIADLARQMREFADRLSALGV